MTEMVTEWTDFTEFVGDFSPTCYMLFPSARLGWGIVASFMQYENTQKLSKKRRTQKMLS